MVNFWSKISNWAGNWVNFFFSMNNLSFQKLPDHFQSNINRIKDMTLKNIYNQFVFSYFSPYYIDDVNHSKNQINEFLLGFLIFFSVKWNEHFKFFPKFKIKEKC